MMSDKSLKRYDLIQCAEHGGEMILSKHGEWVSFDDVESVLSSGEEAERILANLAEMYGYKLVKKDAR
jgi:hypothetical protein